MVAPTVVSRIEQTLSSLGQGIKDISSLAKDPAISQRLNALTRDYYAHKEALEPQREALSRLSAVESKLTEELNNANEQAGMLQAHSSPGDELAAARAGGALDVLTKMSDVLSALLETLKQES
ncbi:MAG: hypothetical protein HOA17_09765 [Candidatus Melainabacteria bacterium]|jgi:predicted  nucleic acid-binding Zn-ribbon protein|nr:hypothetical protein [Candidatus Melainabacteria bacterium]